MASWWRMPAMQCSQLCRASAAAQVPRPGLAPAARRFGFLDRWSSSSLRALHTGRPLAEAARTSEEAAADDSASKMQTVMQRVAGAQWRVFGTLPDNVGARGNKLLRKKLIGPKILSW